MLTPSIILCLSCVMQLCRLPGLYEDPLTSAKLPQTVWCTACCQSPIEELCLPSDFPPSLNRQKTESYFSCRPCLHCLRALARRGLMTAHQSKMGSSSLAAWWWFASKGWSRGTATRRSRWFSHQQSNGLSESRSALPSGVFAAARCRLAWHNTVLMQRLFSSCQTAV